MSENRIGALDEFGSALEDAMRDHKPRPTERRPVRLVSALACGTALLVVFLAMTPPGQSVADAIGDAVGIGDEAPTAPGEEGVYIGVGDTEESFRYEVVATTNASDRGDPETCFFLEFPDADPRVGVGNCITGDDVRRQLREEGAMPFLYGAPDAFSSDAAIVMQTVVPSNVASAVVSYSTADGQSIDSPVYLSSLDEQLSGQIGALDEAGFLLALLPIEILRGTAEDPTALSEGCVTESLEAVDLTLLDGEGAVHYTLNLGHEDFARGLMSVPPEGFSSPSAVSSEGGSDGVAAPVPYRPDTSRDCAD